MHPTTLNGGEGLNVDGSNNAATETLKLIGGGFDDSLKGGAAIDTIEGGGGADHYLVKPVTISSTVVLVQILSKVVQVSTV